MRLTSPQSITAEHDCHAFDCGDERMNRWLTMHGRRNEGRASRTFVVCDDHRVIAYYSLAAGAFERERAPSRLQRNVPDPLPVFVLGRLAVDRAYQGRGIGKALIADALKKALAASEVIGVRAVLVHVLTPDVKPLYTRFGFVESPVDEDAMLLPMERIRDALSE